jgi:hypothetical protein
MSDFALDPHEAATKTQPTIGTRLRKHAGRIVLFTSAAIVLLLVLTQLFLPGIGEGAIEDRLTENGGVADVSLSAVPAARLLWGDGDEVKLDATGIELELVVEPDDPVFADLDRFGDVEITLHDSIAGPFDIESFVLTRSGDGEPYTLRSESTTSVSELAKFGIDRGGLPGSGIVGAIIGATGLGGVEVPVELDMKVVSDDGRLHVIQGGGTVAGFPTGPLAELLTSAIAVEI